MKKINLIGDILLVLGGALYLVELLAYESWALTLVICAIYIVALALLLVNWFGTKDERQAEKARRAAEKAGKAA